MCASPFKFLSAGPPPPRVVLLRDALFFSRAVPVLATATAAEVSAQAGLALEAISPFPLAQLYYGLFWVPGSERALVFASYRRRFTVEQTEAWPAAEWVVPAFASVLGSAVAPATTIVLSSPDGLTAVHWEQGPVPSLVLHRPLAPEATDEDRLHLRAELLRAVGESRAIVDLAEPPAALPSHSDKEVVFKSGGFEATLPTSLMDGLDVRDRDELAMLRRARKRDLVLWRAAIGCVAACGVFALGELALMGAGLWQKARVLNMTAQSPLVGRIMEDQRLAGRIDDLATKRLYPLEMLTVVLSKKPAEVQLLRATTTDLDHLKVDAQTTNSGQISGFISALQAAPECAKVDIPDQRAHDNLATFTLIITFKPGALKPMPPPATS